MTLQVKEPTQAEIDSYNRRHSASERGTAMGLPPFPELHLTERDRYALSLSPDQLSAQFGEAGVTRIAALKAAGLTKGIQPWKATEVQPDQQAQRYNAEHSADTRQMERIGKGELDEWIDSLSSAEIMATGPEMSSTIRDRLKARIEAGKPKKATGYFRYADGTIRLLSKDDLMRRSGLRPHPQLGWTT